ncbi:MAG: hypothetical protein ACTHL8_20645 [Burkholderiaceae bacterium]
MSEPSSAADTPALAARLLARWDRAGLAVRCGWRTRSCTDGVRAYLEAGRRVVRYGVRAELVVQHRMLEVLLQAARDQVLPVAWRAACVEQAAAVLARLGELLAPEDPTAYPALQGAVRAAAGLVARSGG